MSNNVKKISHTGLMTVGKVWEEDLLHMVRLKMQFYQSPSLEIKIVYLHNLKSVSSISTKGDLVTGSAGWVLFCMVWSPALRFFTQAILNFFNLTVFYNILINSNQKIQCTVCFFLLICNSSTHDKSIILYIILRSWQTQMQKNPKCWFTKNHKQMIQRKN